MQSSYHSDDTEWGHHWCHHSDDTEWWWFHQITYSTIAFAQVPSLPNKLGYMYKSPGRAFKDMCNLGKLVFRISVNKEYQSARWCHPKLVKWCPASGQHSEPRGALGAILYYRKTMILSTYRILHDLLTWHSSLSTSNHTTFLSRTLNLGYNGYSIGIVIKSIAGKSV